MAVKVAAIQMCSGVDPQKNADDMARLVRDAAAQGASYVQTPEMTGRCSAIAPRSRPFSPTRTAM